MTTYLAFFITEMELRILNIKGTLIKVNIANGRGLILYVLTLTHKALRSYKHTGIFVRSILSILVLSRGIWWCAY